MDFFYPISTNLTSAKLSDSLNMSLSATPQERELSDDLGTGVSEDLEKWEIIFLYTGTQEELKDTFPFLNFTFLLQNYGITTVTREQLNDFVNSPLVIYVEKPKRLFFEVLEGKRSSCIPTQGVSPSLGIDTPFSNLNGQNVLLAIIDSGIDYTHPDFRNGNNSTRIEWLWDQTIPNDAGKYFIPPTGYSLGTLFTREQINEALFSSPSQRLNLCPSIDISGHGTHVAGIAAGNGRAMDGIYRGVAPDADLCIIKLGSPLPNSFPSTTQLMQAVDFAVRYSLEKKQPLVINLSFGNTYGSHSGTSLLETYLNQVANLGTISIVVGSGNEGSSAGHVMGKITSGETQIIEFSVGDFEQSLSIQIWKNYWDEIRFSLTPPSGTAPIVIPQATGGYRYQTTSRILAYQGAPSPYSPYQELYLELFGAGGFNSNYIEPGVWTLTLKANDVTNGLYDCWMPSLAVRNPATAFLTPSPDITLTIPSTASKVITVGAYNSYSNTLTPFSGRGYTWNTNQIKPDLVAPGVDIISCAPGGGYDTRSGTSMATPFVSGSCALMMQWGIVNLNDPFLYGEKLKAYLIRGAKRLSFSPTYPNPQTGWGALCLRDSF